MLILRSKKRNFQPLDVTTKDDLYFQISCDYNKGEQNFLVKNGIVVGGPEPKSVDSRGKKDEKPNRVSLKILKNQRPVSKVYVILFEFKVMTTQFFRLAKNSQLLSTVIWTVSCILHFF